MSFPFLGGGVGGLRPSEIRKMREAFLRALVLSIILAILTNTLSLFWAIGGEAWFGEPYLYSTPPPYENYDREIQSRLSIQTSGEEPSPTSFKETGFQQKESEEYDNFQSIENIFQYIIQSIRKFFELIFGNPS